MRPVQNVGAFSSHRTALPHNASFDRTTTVFRNLFYGFPTQTPNAHSGLISINARSVLLLFVSAHDFQNSLLLYTNASTSSICHLIALQEIASRISNLTAPPTRQPRDPVSSSPSRGRGGIAIVGTRLMAPLHRSHSRFRFHVPIHHQGHPLPSPARKPVTSSVSSFCAPPSATVPTSIPVPPPNHFHLHFHLHTTPTSTPISLPSAVFNSSHPSASRLSKTTSQAAYSKPRY